MIEMSNPKGIGKSEFLVNPRDLITVIDVE